MLAASARNFPQYIVFDQESAKKKEKAKNKVKNKSREASSNAFFFV